MTTEQDPSGKASHPAPSPQRYEVRFKCSVGIYLSEEDLEIGDFVAVQCGKGYNVGAVSQAIPPEAEVTLKENTKHQKILNKLTEDKTAIEQMLRNKINAENNALALCRTFCHGHRIGTFIDPIAAEFQFDRKKLTIFVMKTGDASVCKLVRKLFDSFKMRISILDIDSVETARQLAIKYLDLSKLNLSLPEVFMDPAAFDLAMQNQAKSGNSQLKRSNLQKQYGNASPSLLSALQEYMPGGVGMSQSSAYHDPGDYRYNQYSQPYPGVGRSQFDRYEPRFTERVYRQEPPSYAYDTFRAQQQPSAYKSPYPRDPRDMNYYPSNSVEEHRYRDDDRFSVKGLDNQYPQDVYYGQFGDYLESSDQFSEVRASDEIQQFDQSFDSSFRQLMLSPHLSQVEVPTSPQQSLKLQQSSQSTQYPHYVLRYNQPTTGLAPTLSSDYNLNV